MKGWQKKDEHNFTCFYSTKKERIQAILIRHIFRAEVALYSSTYLLTACKPPQT